MSKIVQSNLDDYPEAAKKHLDDANALFQAGRSDGCGYLVGYVIECIFKTFFVLEGERTPDIHILDQLSRDASRLAAMAGAKTAKYAFRLPRRHPLYDRRRGWRTGLRYRAVGTVAAKDAADWLAEATQLYNSTIVPMRLDGLV